MSPATTPVSRSFAAAGPPTADVDSDGLEGLENACLGFGLPAAAEQEIQLAGAAYHAEAEAERHVLRAFELAPEHPATHIALYRFYFYRNRLAEALAVGLRCLAHAAALNGLAHDWRVVAPGSTDFGDYSALPRFYLFTLKGCAYLSLRLGKLEQGGAMLEKLTELDAGDKVGGSVLRGVLDRLGQIDDD
ncbi:MAG: hypothetical protein NT159_18005 [Proteobacteria bacterium]|nr:hypothetical protein [Pseudomonadota bacterium]